MVEQQCVSAGVLYIVPTPIGNLGDMVPRAIDILQTVDLIAVEDTRHSARLLQHFQIKTPVTAYHDYSNEAKVQGLIERLCSGLSVALISDAGTPLISDPGYRLVNLARQHAIRVVPIPGACAAIAALSASGLPSDRFSFEGFPPAKKGARQSYFSALTQHTATLIFYESPHRILACLEDIAETFGRQRDVVVAREISKTFETFLSGPADEVVQKVQADPNQQKGEFVVMVKGFQAEAPTEGVVDADAQRLMTLLNEQELPLKVVAAITADVFSDKKNRLYAWALENLKS